MSQKLFLIGAGGLDLDPDALAHAQAVVYSESRMKEVLLNYTIADWASWSSIQMQPTQNQTYVGTIPGQSAGTTVAYKIVAFDEVENYAEAQNSYVVKAPSNLTCVLSNSTIYFGEEIFLIKNGI